MDIQYAGEHLWPGLLGHFLVILGFASTLFAFYSYRKVDRSGSDTLRSSWRKLGRIGFLTSSISVVSVIALIFYIMINRYYEYQYVWQHVSDDLPMRYIFSAFWEGQEGSFLLWMFWHAILGLVVLLKGGRWESAVLSTLCIIQAFILSMLLGLHLGDETAKIGSSPFLLIRDVFDAPIFNTPDYLSLIQGQGLNPLLQNYWMTIHPPTLFLGFAALSLPFCYAMAGLRLRAFTDILSPLLGWALFAAMILGTGILMGGAWAYEALSFGGYWAWDPVENMSLVPWLVLVAALHSNLIAKNTGRALKATFLLYASSFVLILYSTFLTRSGILGDSSVHAFTEMGLENQLVLFILFFTVFTAYWFFKRRKEMPVMEKEEAVYSREFWMFIGTLILLFSALLITYTTSIPVYNKILDGIAWLTNSDYSHLHRSGPIEPEAHYNKYQLWIAVFIGLLSGVAQLLRYKESNWIHYRKKALSRLGLLALASLVGTYLINLWIGAQAWQYLTLLYFSVFAVFDQSHLFDQKAELEFQILSLGHLSCWFWHHDFGCSRIRFEQASHFQEHLCPNRSLGANKG